MLAMNNCCVLCCCVCVIMFANERNANPTPNRVTAQWNLNHQIDAKHRETDPRVAFMVVSARETDDDTIVESGQADADTENAPAVEESLAEAAADPQDGDAPDEPSTGVDSGPEQTHAIDESVAENADTEIAVQDVEESFEGNAGTESADAANVENIQEPDEGINTHAEENAQVVQEPAEENGDGENSENAQDNQQTTNAEDDQAEAGNNAAEETLEEETSHNKIIFQHAESSINVSEIKPVPEAKCEPAESNPVHEDTTPPNFIVETGVFVDKPEWDKAMLLNNNDEQKADAWLRRGVSAMFGQTQALYRLPSMKPHIGFKIVSFEVWKNEQPSELVNEKRKHDESGNLGNVLPFFNGLVDQRKEKFDMALLITGVSFGAGGEASGSAGGSVCKKGSKGVYVQGLGPYGLPHEIAHMVAMDHDRDLEVSCWDDNQPEAKREFAWSARRIWDLNVLLRKKPGFGGDVDIEVTGCLTDTSSTPPEIEISDDPNSDFPVEEICRHDSTDPSAKIEEMDLTYPSQCRSTRCVSTSRIIWEGDGTPYKGACPCGICFPTMDFGRQRTFCGKQGEYNALAKYNFAYGICTGYEIANGRSAKQTLLECAKWCDEHSECRAFGFIDGNCELKNSDCFLELKDSHNKINQFYIKEFDFEKYGETIFSKPARQACASSNKV